MRTQVGVEEVRGEQEPGAAGVEVIVSEEPDAVRHAQCSACRHATIPYTESKVPDRNTQNAVLAELRLDQSLYL